MKNSKFSKIIVAIIIIFAVISIKSSVAFAGTLSSDINGINDSAYPGVKSLIQKLQNAHSNYHFQVYYTGIDWTEAVTMEYQGHKNSPKNLFNEKSNYTGKWFCPICGKESYDTGWYCASIEAIEYMMDPRNSLDETSVYQFKNLEASDVSANNIQDAINSKHASYSYLNNSTAINAIVTASNNYSMNGFSILAKIANEQGVGTSPLVTGSGYNGNYVGYYNFFNVGAYGNGTSTVLMNGLKHAKNKGWNSVTASILGGSEYYKSQYIGRGQNTLYYQRFNVVYNPSLFSHQYQQDIMGAQTSATLLKGYYTATSTINSVNHTFIIPLYDHMPSKACSRPSTTENQNLKLEEATVLQNKLPVKASPTGNRIISYLNSGEKIKVVKRATNTSSDGQYWDTVVSIKDGTYGYVRRSGLSSYIDVNSYVFDSDYYANTYPDLKAAFGTDKYKLYDHFKNSGIKEGRSSSPVLNVKYYVENNSDLKSAFGNNYVAAMYHFNNTGYKEYRISSSNYNGKFYKYYYSDLTHMNADELINHYINSGRKEGRIGGIDSTIYSIVFNANEYANLYDDLKSAFGTDSGKLEKHWLQSGINEGRTASIVFDLDSYKSYNADLANAFGNNNKKFFEHFVTFGIKENRRTSLIFCPQDYLDNNVDLRSAFGTNYKLLFTHFRNNGINEGRTASSVFSVGHYLAVYPDLKSAFGNNYRSAIIHFAKYGINEGRNSSPSFNVLAYKNNYSDLRSAFGNQYKKYYAHYLVFGRNEGRKAT